ncbi:MAG: hypothetical protein AAF899_16795, partial [Pseudomonadota bacterium]
MRRPLRTIIVALTAVSFGFATDLARASDGRSLIDIDAMSTVAAPDGSLVRLLGAEQDRVSALLAKTLSVRLSHVPDTAERIAAESAAARVA